MTQFVGIRRLATVMVCLWSACGSCSGPPSELRVGGETPYVRCVAAEPPEARRWTVGAFELEREGRTLRIGGLPSPIRVAAFAGPGHWSEPLNDAGLQSVGDLDPHVVLVIGGVGDGEELARENLAALGALNVPSVIIAGGRDDAGDLEEAFEALGDEMAPRVIDARPLRRIHLGDDVLIPWSGAPRGRYARNGDACGFGSDDVDRAVDALGAGDDRPRRWLVSWAAPRGRGVTRGLDGVDVGASSIKRLAEGIGVAGGVFAWPRVSALRPVDGEGRAVAAGAASEHLHIVVRPLVGSPVVRGDGSRLRAGPTLLRLGPEGLAVAAPTTRGRWTE